MKKYLMLGMLVASIQAVAVEYSVNVGLDPFRRTAVESTDESADIGLSLGGESIWSKDKLKYGLGLELRTETSQDNGWDNFYSHPIYGVLKYNVWNDYYVLGRLGRVFNEETVISEKGGNYFAFGVGKSFGNVDVELVHEASETIKEGSGSNLKTPLDLFKDGNLETVSLKVAYVFGRTIDTTGPEVSLISQVEGDKVTWTYGVTERKAKITETYLNGKAVPVEADGTFSAEGLPTGRYALEVVAVDKKGNITRKTEPVIIVDKNSEITEKELKEFVAGERSLPIIVGYEVNVTELTDVQKKRLQDGVYVLDGLKGTLSVVGYTDDTGTDDLNLMLSKERAQTVAEMVKKVVKNPDDIKIVTVGRGETNFKVPNDSDANRKLNRRIEFEFKSDSGEVIKSEEFTK